MLNIIPEIGEIIEDHFSPEEIEEIKNNLFFCYPKDVKLTSLENFNDKNKNMRENDSHLNLDLFITFAKSHLPKNKYVRFLSILGDRFIRKENYTTAEDIFYQVTKIIHNNSKELLVYKADALLSLAAINSEIAKWEICIKYLNASLNLFRRINDMVGIAKCENLFGTIYGEMGDLLKAKKYFEDSLKKLVDYDDYDTIGKIEINLGIINLIQGNLFRASSYLKKSLMAYTELKDEKRVAQIRMNLGILAVKGQDYSKGIQEIDKALELAKENNLKNIECLCLCNKTIALIKKGNVIGAESILPEIKVLCEKLNDKLSLAEYYRLQGLVTMHYGNYKFAEQYFLTSIRINKEFDNLLNTAETYIDLAVLYQKMNNKKESNSFFREAFKFFKDINAAVEINLLLKYM